MGAGMAKTAGLKVDLCVIGAGAAGLSAAAGAAQLGARVALIEAGRMGGDCLNSGCVPSKALLAAARAGLDYDAAMARAAAAVAAIAPHDSAERFAGLGVTVIRGWARFVSPRTVEVAGRHIRARRFLLATGARPWVPDLPGLVGLPYLTNETLFDLRVAPGHLLILGGGPMGVEMAEAHRRLGVAVTLVEAGRCLAREEPELAAVVCDSLRAIGVTILEGAAAVAVEGEAGALALRLADGRRVGGTHLLLATGRRPALEGLGLAAAGIAAAEGRIAVDARLRTANRRVYAAGDAVSPTQLTHVAGYQAGLVLRQVALGLPARVRSDHIPRVVYTEPELAQIGLTEAEARARFADVAVVTLPLAGTDRAVTEGIARGALKLVVRRGRPLGVGIVGPGAGELIAPWAVVFASRLKLAALTRAVLPYPTLSEVSKQAAGAYFSPKLFDNAWLKWVVRAVQRLVP